MVSPEHYPKLLDIQVECIRSLGDTYSQREIDTWIGYLERATSDRFAAFKNRAWIDSEDDVGGFVSWSENFDDNTTTLECLYVRGQYRGRGIGRLLLQEAEQNITPGSSITVRSTLNAQSFYKQNGYRFHELNISRAGFSIAILGKITPR